MLDLRIHILKRLVFRSSQLAAQNKTWNMKRECEELYKSMKEEIRLICNQDFVSTYDIAHCYNLTMKYWKMVGAFISSSGFKSKEEEIWYFRNCKPLFAAEIFYFELIYFIEMLEPNEGGAIQEFLLQEKERLPKFVAAHPEFYRYYKSGDTSKDEQLFIQQAPSQILNCEITAFEEDEDSQYDYLVAKLCAFERFDQYITEKLIRLGAYKMSNKR